MKEVMFAFLIGLVCLIAAVVIVVVVFASNIIRWVFCIEEIVELLQQIYRQSSQST